VERLDGARHHREKDVIVVPFGDKIERIRGIFGQFILLPILNRLRAKGAFYETDPTRVSKFAVLTARTQWRTRAAPTMDRREAGVIENDFAVLMSLTHAYELLVKHGITPFYQYLAESNNQDGQRFAGTRAQLLQNPKYNELLAEINVERASPRYVGHPKLERLENIVLNHFLQHDEQNVGLPKDQQRATRIMIFSEYRDSVDEIVTVRSVLMSDNVRF
jgi:ERCC4-related helicase